MKRAPWWLAAVLVCATPAAAQDFSPAAGAGPGADAAALLDRALGSPQSGVGIECGAARRFGLPELDSRALAVTLARGSVCVAAGMAQAGEPEFGWNAGAIALGSAHSSGGVALRALARRERRAGALAAPTLRAGAGIEGGAGGWLALGGPLLAWASVPQAVVTGEAPPLARALQLGLRVRGEPGAAWAAVEAPRAGADGERALGGELSAGPLVLWAEGRDGPWRASLGVRARRGALGVALRVDAHPHLPESSFLWLSVSPGSRRRS